MTAFKQLLASDIIVTPFEVNKAFRFTGSAGLTDSNVGIDRFLGQNIQGLFSLNEATTGTVTTEYRRLVYNSIKELYYSNYLSSSYGDPVSAPYTVPGSDPSGNVLVGPNSSAGRYENYLQNTLTFERYFPTASNAIIGVISIPSKLYGDKIQPGSFIITSDSGSIIDDANGNLLTEGGEICGTIVYQHGLAVITYDGALGSYYGVASYGVDTYGGDTTGFVTNFIASSNVTCSFSSSFTIFETQYKCTFDPSEFNFSLNPSLISGSTEGIIYNFATGSYFNPYVTTVGLYNENQDLIAVGKLAKPLPSNNTTDTTIIINIDR
tara:strand:+ start:19215 stop:20183 length:969 start_codon:yes stop_codon:yes gene_type:complete